MAVDPSVVINLAAEYTGAKAFKQADTATDKLTKSVKSLAKAFGVAFSVNAAANFAKASVKAAAADEKAQKQLALALKNVGLNRDTATAESFVQKLQSEFGVVDDKLRPAYQQLAVATHSTLETQKLLNLALDISASTGKDLGSVTSALSKAYLGSNTALSKLGIGISKADLKTKSFADVTDQLAVTFAGSATQSANTFSGSIDRLGVASNDVKEIIGTGIIDSLKLLGGDTNIDTATRKMRNFATATNETLVGMTSILEKIKGNKLGGAILNTFGDVLSNFQPFASFRKEGAKVNLSKLQPFPQGAPADLTALSKYSIADKLTKNTSAVTKLTAAQIAQTKLDKAKAMFDLKRIGIAAALQGNITGDSRNRLMAMQAIENGDAANATKYSTKINANAPTSVTVNVTPQNLVSTKEDLVAQVAAAMETARRRSGAGVGR